MDDKLKDKFVEQLRTCLIYPETLDKEQWERAEIINQKILNLINEIIKL